MSFKFVPVALMVGMLTSVVVGERDRSLQSVGDRFSRKVFPGVGASIGVDQVTALEISQAGGRGVYGSDALAGVVSIVTKQGGNRDLNYYSGPGFTQRLSLGTDIEVRGLSKRGWKSGNRFLFSTTIGGRPYLLDIAQDGSDFQMDQISDQPNFTNTDMMVTEEGQAWVAAYDALNFRPRLMYRATAGPWGEIDLNSLTGVYLGDLFGSPALSFVPEVLDNKVHFFMSKQQSSFEDAINLISVDRNSMLATERNLGFVATPIDFQPAGDEDTAAFAVDGNPGLVYMNRGAFYLGLVDLESDLNYRKSFAYLPKNTLRQTVSVDEGPGPNQVTGVFGGFAQTATFPRRDVWSGATWADQDIEPGPRYQTGLFGGPQSVTTDDRGRGYVLGNGDSGLSFGDSFFGETRIVPQVIQGATRISYKNLENWDLRLRANYLDTDGVFFEEDEATLAPHETRDFLLSGSLGTAGYGVIQANGRFETSSLWLLDQFVDSPNASARGTVGSLSWTGFAEFNDSRSSAFALANPHGVPNVCLAQLYDAGGGAFPPLTLNFDPFGQKNQFIKDLFPDLEEGFRGSIRFDCQRKTSGVAGSQTGSGAFVTEELFGPRQVRFGVRFTF